MHPYISQVMAAERAAEAIRAADASRRAKDARQAVAVSGRQSHQPHPAYWARRAFRRQQPCTAGLTVSGQPCR
jgi:hypothetical protein